MSNICLKEAIDSMAVYVFGLFKVQFHLDSTHYMFVVLALRPFMAT